MRIQDPTNLSLSLLAVCPTALPIINNVPETVITETVPTVHPCIFFSSLCDHADSTATT